MDNLTHSVLYEGGLSAVEDDRKDRKAEIPLPEFPLWWLEESKRNMEALRVIASHLHGKTAAGRTSRQGFVGDASEMEKQIIRNLIDLEQQMAATVDVVQAAIQIIAEDHWRRTHKVKRFFIWIRETAKKVERKLNENVFYKILVIASTLGLLLWVGKMFLAFGKYLIHIIRP